MQRFLSSNMIPFLYHPWSQSILEIDNIQHALIYKLYELGYSEKEIANILSLSEADVFNSLKELNIEITKLKPREIMSFNRPTILMLFSELRCNLRCKYCYTKGGGVYSKFSSIQSMDMEVARKAIDIASELGINQVNVFGGGEPLLNKKVIEYILHYIDSKHYPMVFGLITNGTLIDKKFVDLIQSYNDITVLTVSIDGPKLVHDLNRVYYSGGGSYYDVTKGIKLLKDADITFELQSTYPLDAYKLGYTPFDVALFLSQFTPFIVLRFANYNKQFGTGIKPYDSLLGQLFIEYVDRSINELRQEKPRFYEESICLNLSFIARKAVKKDPCPFTHFITVLPNGKLLTCHMVTDLLLGNVNDNIETIIEKHKNAVEYNKRFSKLLDYRDFWYSSIQDICPAELLGGLTRILSSKGKVKLDAFDKSIMESYWDSLLINVYKSAKEGLLNKIYINLEYTFNKLYKKPKKINMNKSILDE